MNRQARWASNTAGLAAVLAILLAVSLAISVAASTVVSTFMAQAATEIVASEPQSDTQHSGARAVMAEISQTRSGGADELAVPALQAAMCAGVVHPAIATEFMTADDGTQALAIMMPPGLGVHTAESLKAGWAECGLTAGAHEWDTPSPASFTAAAADGTAVTLWVRGDLVLVVAGSESFARALDDDAVAALTTHGCADLGGRADQWLRNPVAAGEEYRPLSVPVSVSIPTPAPRGSDGEALDAPRGSDIPNPGEQVELPVVPQGRTYWPELPDAVPYPRITPPAPAPPSDGVVDRVVADPVGPGCGWEFFAYAVDLAEPDTDAAVDAKVAQVEQEMSAQWEAWRVEVQEFWASRDHLLGQVSAYQAYRDDVEQVSQQWEGVAALWDAYEAQASARASALQELEQWTLARQQAQAEYDSQQAACVDVADAPEGAATADEELSLTSPGSCPAERPSILDEEPPSVPEPPVAPAPPLPDESDAAVED